ncbi:hypothetical protein L210DRAFT_691505 [Boletus edulis BED1]|uniref:BTB domain-containing protein n=1 Tax=Boletus edulis BED1 TaxID=1328754 RepID=A0AAD4C7H1_BOLED|nr:hypothetical protein L210DRAFT_691505 [Boletus edulis BED1]
MTGTSMVDYSVTYRQDPESRNQINSFITITAMPAYEGTSSEELRMEDYRRKFQFPTPTAFGQQQQQQQSASASLQPKTASAVGSGGIFVQPVDFMLDPSKLECLEGLVKKLLLGEELVNTQFHLFSAKSPTSGHVMKPRVLCANNALLAQSSTYFMDLLSRDISSSDPSFVDLVGDNDIPSDAPIDDYDYESDSDLDNCDDDLVAKPDASKGLSAPKDDDELSDDGSEAVSSNSTDNPEQPREDEPFTVSKDGDGSVASSETVVRETRNDNGLGNQTAMYLRSLRSRHVLVKDTAFRTWYTLLNYLHTGRFTFLPLSSTTAVGSSTSPLDVPRCSAKSMYRLASKVGLDHLRDAALVYIRNNLTEHNILKELSCSIVSKHPQLLEMELDVLYAHIASPTVVAHFAALAQRVAQRALPHGADIMIGIHTRLLKAHHPSALKPTAPPELVKTDVSMSDTPQAEDEHKTGLSPVDQPGTEPGSLPSSSGRGESIFGVPSQVSASLVVSTASTAVQGKKKKGRK